MDRAEKSNEQSFRISVQQELILNIFQNWAHFRSFLSTRGDS
jgi:hypothetical protein